ncbi:MAG TPA: SDR family oxidoreductase, partial [Thermodesulfobacteriota bacterium]|nr:SDR family oxidoreductase [Thermodesulfobacteriota bacterium]
MGKDWVKGKVAVITGGAGGIGAALAVKFGRQGARVALVDVDSEGLKRKEGELRRSGVDTFSRKADISDESECVMATRDIVGHFGGIDILINNAGISHRGPFCEAEISTIRRIMEVNFFGSLICTKAALDSIVARKGMIIVVSSIAGLTPLLGRTAYCASKHALHGMFSTLRGELRGKGVHVMIACPWFTRTNLALRALDGRGETTPHPRTTAGREASPEEVAEAI